MAEGGLLPWKTQNINVDRGPVSDYKEVHKPLPPPPKGMKWNYDQSTREWSIVAEEKQPVPHETILSVKENDTASSFTTAESKTPIYGKDYVDHEVLPTDTLQGICLRYGINATKLRQANNFSGSNLLLAPSKLIIPLTGKPVKVLDRTSNKGKIHAFCVELPNLGPSEAKAYLELSDWDLTEALTDAKEDIKWDKDDSKTN
mmetsp:Transcript_24385/g.35655  ORF Transcript_24385/g.35655 Transcript_24385/m.35655 type:complete len:202 (+) Transcript_24385:42-647(+)|eukprot:CAMPEP_0195517546 /NCGR_PEP_ID=MMETSP0794_2-20130614/11003_1 /TAXON_ID=515487 /ORGANISM="Stephanopyxis turris, Strain CCMP 815" /LENGTH=201 /DNA_ID=CAMNT_0040646365 /DNA_START=40 /DNA_END=645 /DNA_ORIENTATION=-